MRDSRPEKETKRQKESSITATKQKQQDFEIFLLI